MKLIAHRANLNGPCPSTENNPKQIDSCIESGYDVEIDLRYDQATDVLWLGHDEPQYSVTWWWLSGRAEHLWIHCKDLTTLHEFTTQTKGYNFFYHDKDDYTLTSKQFIWAFPGKSYSENTVVVMPEWQEDRDWDVLRATNCHGVCSDFVERLI